MGWTHTHQNHLRSWCQHGQLSTRRHMCLCHDTGGAISAWIRRALIKINFTVDTSPARTAGARILHDARRCSALAFVACSTVHARCRRALLDGSTVFAGVAGLIARVAHTLVHTDPNVNALSMLWIAVILGTTARVNLISAVFPRP